MRPIGIGFSGTFITTKQTIKDLGLTELPGNPQRVRVANGLTTNDAKQFVSPVDLNEPLYTITVDPSTGRAGVEAEQTMIERLKTAGRKFAWTPQVGLDKASPLMASLINRLREKGNEFFTQFFVPYAGLKPNQESDLQLNYPKQAVGSIMSNFDGITYGLPEDRAILRRPIETFIAERQQGYVYRPKQAPDNDDPPSTLILPPPAPKSAPKTVKMPPQT